MSDIRTMTDKELLELCQARPWEDRLVGLGCLGTIPFSLFAALLTAGAFRGFLSAVIFVVVLIAGIGFLTWLTWGIAGFRSRHFLWELRRRYGQLSVEESLADCARRFEEAGAPDSLLVFYGAATGRHVDGTAYAVVGLYQKPVPRGWMEVRTSKSLHFPTEPGSGLKVHRLDLPESEAVALLELIGATRKSGLPSVLRRVEAGYLCSIAVLDRDPARADQGRCDLLGILDSEAGRPVPMLIRAMLRLASTVSSHPLIAGWADMPGDCGQMDFEIYVGDAGERLSAPFGPDLLVVLQGESSDEDPYFSLVRIELYLDEERPGRVQVITGPEMVDSNRFNPVNILRGDADLRSEESQDLLQWLQTLAPDDLKDVPYKGGGYPCSIAVLDRDGIRGRGSCVLIGTSPEHAGDPTCLLVCRVFGLAERVSNSPLIAGWKAPIEAPRESEFDFVHAKARLADSDAPDWIVLLHYRALPLRGPYSFWLELSDGTVPAGLLKTVDRHYPNSAEDPRHAFATLVLILTQEQAETMLQFLRPLKRRALTSLPSNAVDGASCQITVLRRQPRMVQKGDCNLGGLRDEDRDSPTPQLIRLLLQVARETQSTPPNPSADDAAN